MEYALIYREKTKKGPPVNKHISVWNIKAQIANMSFNECAGFKSEYHVRTNEGIFFFFIMKYVHENVNSVHSIIYKAFTVFNLSLSEYPSR